MCPELLQVGPVVVRSYGVMLALSFLLGTLYVWRMAQRFDRPFVVLLGMAYVLIIGGILGARLGYVVIHLHEFADDPWAVVNPFGQDQIGIAGMNVYAGMLLAMLGAWLWCRWKGLGVLDTFDLFAPAFALGLGLTRIGCLLNGCCFGTPSELPWAVSFPPGSIPYAFLGATTLHPTQLYSAVHGLVLFGLLHLILMRRRFAGQVVAVLLVVESTARYLIESVRFYETKMYVTWSWWQPTYNQLVAIALLSAGIVVYVTGRRGHARTQLPPAGE
jgi:phosphatidylglycerol:prolipoprotein diacylglycerol transferase